MSIQVLDPAEQVILWMDSPPPSRIRAHSWQDSDCRWSHAPLWTFLPCRPWHSEGTGTLHPMLAYPDHDGPGVLPQTMIGGIVLVTLVMRIPGALDAALLLISQHPVQLANNLLQFPQGNCSPQCTSICFLR